MYKAGILCDSLNTQSGCRLTTFEVTYPRFVHSELLTHRLFSRNSSSSRAIPNERLISSIENDPALPVWWGKNQKGMQANEQIDDISAAEYLWLRARNIMLSYSRSLAGLGVHKQVCNRLIEPWMYITVLISSTEWGNFFHLRSPENPNELGIDPQFPAQPELQKIARMMQDLYEDSEPELKLPGEWHLPFTSGDDPLSIDARKKLSVARCARVSYLTHDNKRDIGEDLRLHDYLAESGHWSPFEHQAVALDSSGKSGNFTGWRQYRKEFDNEHFGRPLI